LVTAKVILEQNIDPGWFVYPLMRGGKREGGRCHNSVKTSIFKNSVSSLPWLSSPSRCGRNYQRLPPLSFSSHRGYRIKTTTSTICRTQALIKQWSTI
jgi:hypothetical protein